MAASPPCPPFNLLTAVSHYPSPLKKSFSKEHTVDFFGGLLGTFNSEVHREARITDLKKKEERKAYAVQMLTEAPKRKSQRSEQETPSGTLGYPDTTTKGGMR